MGWIFKTGRMDNRTISGIRKPTQADACNRVQSQISERPLKELLPRVRHWEGNILYQGRFPMIPGHPTRDLRPQLLRGIFEAFCGSEPTILIYSDPESSARSIFSQCVGGSEIRAAGDQLIDGLPVETMLTGFMGNPDQSRTELRAFLEQITEYLSRQGCTITPQAAAELLRRPAPLLQDAPPPKQDGSFDFLAVSADQREQMARMLAAFCEEWGDPGLIVEENSPAQSFCEAVRNGNSVSCYCSWDMSQTWKLLGAVLQRLDRDGVPFRLILDQPPMTRLATLLSVLHRHRAFVRVNQTPGFCADSETDLSESFRNLVSHFETCILSGVGAGASLWSEQIGKYDRVLQSNSATSGVFFDMRVLPGFRRDRNQSYAVSPGYRMPPEQLRALCHDTGSSFVVCRNGAVILYE